MTKFSNRRSISSVIGGAVFLVLFISGFTVFMFAIQVSSDRFSEQLSSSFEETIRGNESFTISPSVNLPANGSTLFIEVLNTGSVPLNIQDAFVVNVATGVLLEYEINFQDAHIAPNESRAIMANYGGATSKTIANGIYDVKVVSLQGTTKIQKLTVPLNPLFTDMFTIPKNLGSGQNVTITLFVYNRGNSTVFDVAPVLSTTAMTDPSTSLQNSVGPIPPTINSLEPQESVFFAWEQKVVGAVGTQIAYNNTAAGRDGASSDTVTGNYDVATVEFVPQAVSLVQRPEIKILIPSPSGEENDSEAAPLWGVNVINPTSFDIDVSRVIITAVKNATGNLVFDEGGGGCHPDPLFPTGGVGTWSCPAENVLQWESISAPITIKGKHMQAFITQVDPSVLGGSGNDPSTNIFVTVYSSYGPATDLAVPTGLAKGALGGVVGIFMTNVTSGILPNTSDPGALVQNTVIGNIQGIISGALVILNVTLAVMSDNTSAEISSGRIIINIPSGFIINNLTDINNFFSSPELTTTNFSDGSKQIAGAFTGLGADDKTQAVVVQVNMTAPIVTTNATYTIFALAEGVTVGSQPIGPVVQFPLQVLDVDCGTDPDTLNCPSS